jgi:type I restriction enzyme S subunit
LFRVKEGIEPIFVLNYLQFPKTIHRLLETQAGSARQNLSLADIRNFSFVLPPLSEQRRITAILPPLDEQIERESSHKKELETLKKGLMQVLLTGKLRAKV